MRIFLAAALAAALTNTAASAAPVAPDSGVWVTHDARETEDMICHDCFEVSMRLENEQKSDVIVIYDNDRRADFLAAFDVADLASVGARRLDPASLGRPVVAALVKDAKECFDGLRASGIPGIPLCFID